MSISIPSAKICENCERLCSALEKAQQEHVCLDIDLMEKDRELKEQRAILRELAEALKESLKLSTYSVMSEESSSSHNHGPRAAAKYGEKTRAIEQKIQAALARAEEVLNDNTP